MRYKEFKEEGKLITEDFKINEVLAKHKMHWVLNAELEDARLGIFKNTLVFNSGTWYNGIFEYGVFRNGHWKFGEFVNGVWYNGIWYNGLFKSGLIFEGKFLLGQILSGEVKGSAQFVDCEISPNVKILTK